MPASTHTCSTATSRPPASRLSATSTKARPSLFARLCLYSIILFLTHHFSTSTIAAPAVVCRHRPCPRPRHTRPPDTLDRPLFCFRLPLRCFRRRRPPIRGPLLHCNVAKSPDPGASCSEPGRPPRHSVTAVPRRFPFPRCARVARLPKRATGVGCRAASPAGRG